MKNKGLFGKYIIQKSDGSPVDEGAEYFVLRLNGDGDLKHIEACKKAILVYAEEIKDHLPLLSKDLLTKYRFSSKEQGEKEPNILGLDNAWPLKNVLEKLIEATNILLHNKSYDGQGYEEMQICVSRAKEIIGELSTKSASGEPQEQIISDLIKEWSSTFGGWSGGVEAVKSKYIITRKQ